VIWVLFGGLELALVWFIAGLVFFVFIVTIPFGIQAMKMANFTLWPFGRGLVKRADRGRVSSGIGNLVWLLVAGIWLAAGHLFAALICAITIIGIPLALAHLKIAKASLGPFGKVVVRLADLPHAEQHMVEVSLG